MALAVSLVQLIYELRFPEMGAYEMPPADSPLYYRRRLWYGDRRRARGVYGDVWRPLQPCRDSGSRSLQWLCPGQSNQVSNHIRVSSRDVRQAYTFIVKIHRRSNPRWFHG